MLRLFGKTDNDHEIRVAAPVRSATSGGAGVLDRADCGLWAVAAGIGTRAGDAVAAAAAIEALAALADAAPVDPEAIRAQLGRVNLAVRAVRPDPRRSAGASVVALHVGDGVATLLWAGDCRAYRYRGGALDLLTRDHSALHELIDAGVAIGDVRPAHLVTRAIGVGATIEIDTLAVPLVAGDRLLLCARDLPVVVPTAMIAGRLRASPADAVEALVEALISAGGASGLPVVAVEIG